MSSDISTGIQRARDASPFSRGGFFAVLAVGFIAFVALLYFIAVGDTGERDSGGAAHAAANGLNGYAGLVQLLEADGLTVEKSYEREGLGKGGLLILTPPAMTDMDEFIEILNDRQFVGPTMVILPKWFTTRPMGEIAEEDREAVRDDWVRLAGTNGLGWNEDSVPAPYGFDYATVDLDEGRTGRWSGLGLSGSLPTGSIAYAKADPSLEPLIIDPSGRYLAFEAVGDTDPDYYDSRYHVTFVTEPDLVNNFGLADATRAAAAVALVNRAGAEDAGAVTFDLTLNGYGDTVNLLTLAFRPPFLAATLCLILAMLIVAWRAFLRFGPTALGGQELAFGKSRLVRNGAGLIIRARRLRLLADPYVALTERRLARILGLGMKGGKPDSQAIDDAIARRLPSSERYSALVDRLRDADKPMDILRSAQALNSLTKQLSGKPA